MTWKERLIARYCYSSEDKKIQQHLATLRMSNHYQPAFRDEEVMTVYVFGIINGRSKVTPIYTYTRNHLLDWFPQLPSYQGFNYRLNQLSGCFEVLVCSLNRDALLEEPCLLPWNGERVIDSL